MQYKSLVDTIYNIALFKHYALESAAAISATIISEGAGEDLLVFKGERYKRYANYCEKYNISPIAPSSKVKCIFYDLNNYNTSKLKYATTIDDAVHSFNRDYLGKTLNKTEALSLVILANDIHRTFVSIE